MIIPVPTPLCGVIIIGENSIFYHDGSSNIIHLPIRQVNYYLLKIIHNIISLTYLKFSENWYCMLY